MAATGEHAGPDAHLAGHGGTLAVAAAQAHGVDTVFTLSGAHVFPVYDAAVNADPPVRLVDVRHEATAVFAAEATARLTRTPGLAVVTAGPGVTNSISAVTTAFLAGSPVVVLGGRAPQSRWGTGALQELDQPPLLTPITKSARTVHDVAALYTEVDAAFSLAGAAHRGPVFLDIPIDQVFASADVPTAPAAPLPRPAPDPEAVAAVGALLARASRPVMVLGSDVWADRAEDAAVALVEALGAPVVTNGMGRGLLPPGHPLLVTRARRAALVVVVGTSLDFRLGYGVFGSDRAHPTPVCHLADAPDQLARHLPLAASAAGDLGIVCDGVRSAWEAQGSHALDPAWPVAMRAAADAAARRDATDLASAADPIHPARIYGELLPRLAPDSVVIGDGGDFVSFAGRYVEPARPGGWLDPGPFGCLGTGLGYAMAARLARPSAQVVLLLGDGAAGFSLMDVDSLVRHQLPVTMVVGNNAGWGLERHPMRSLFGYDVAADLAPATRYDQVVAALGGAGELVADPRGIGAALDRGLNAGVPYLVNVVTDPDVAYPRRTTGV